MAIHENAAAHMPDVFDFTAAAAIPLTGLTAYQAITEELNAKPGETLFFPGGSGSFGQMAVPIAKSLGLRVIVSGNSRAKDVILSAGADQYIEYTKEDYWKILSDVDYVIDALGEKEFSRELSVLKKGGILLSLRTGPNKALNALVNAKEETIENLQGLIETVCQTDSLDAEQERLKQELRIIAENLANLIRENASVALGQAEQAEKEGKLRALYGEKHSRFQELEALIQEKHDTKEILTNFITKLEDLTGKQTEFREELWGGLVDHIRIDEKSSTVVFRGGIEITI